MAQHQQNKRQNRASPTPSLLFLRSMARIASNTPTANRNRVPTTITMFRIRSSTIFPLKHSQTYNS